MSPLRPAMGAVIRGLSIFVLILLPLQAKAATDGQAARAFLENLADEAIAALTPPDISDAEREQRCRELLRENFAVQTIGQFVLGRYWKAASPEERAEYMRLFEDLIVTTYVGRFKRYTGQKLLITGATPDSESGDVTVNSQIERTGGAPVAIGWRVREEGQELKVVDVYVEGVSMGQTQRSDFSSVIRNNGGSVAGLLAEMRKRIYGNAG